MIKTILLFAITALPVLAFAQQKNQTDHLGQKQGIWEKTDPNGRVIYSGTFKDNYPIGEMKRYHENGNLKAIMVFSSKGHQVKASLFNESSILTAKGNFIDSQKDSVWLYFDKTGSIRATESYSSGIKNGLSSYLFKNGNLYETIDFQNGIKHGIWKRYFENGNPYFEAQYQNGLLHGGFQVYYPNGVIESSGEYLNNKKEGIWEYYSDRGELLFRLDYKNGIATNQDELDKLQTEKLKKMEEHKQQLIDPEKYVDDPDTYLQLQR